MALAPGPEDLACSARGCRRKAEVAIIWSNPAIHTGRSKTWLACRDHRDSLQQYLAYRDFPTRVVPIDEVDS